MNFTEQEIDLLTASLWFAHLNRKNFYDYVRDQGHGATMTYMETKCDINELRRKLSDLADAQQELE